MIEYSRSFGHISPTIAGICLTLLAAQPVVAASRATWQVSQPGVWHFEKIPSPSVQPAFKAFVPGYSFQARVGGFSFTGPTDAGRWSWVNGSRRAVPEGAMPTGAVTNYFLGQQRQNWRTKVQSFEKIRYRSVWPGIDVVLYGSGSRFEYDFIVGPGADPGQIGIRVEGVSRIHTDVDGSVIFQTDRGSFRQAPAILYQEIQGKRVPVRGRYSLSPEGYVKLEVADYDHRKPLIIDPVITLSVQIGANGTESTAGIARDRLGNLYLAGTTASSSLPAPTGTQTSNAGRSDAFVIKLDPQGNVLYSTYLGGSGDDHATGVALDDQGNVYVAGWTTSLNFPIRNALQPNLIGGREGFLAKFSPDGQLLYSTYIGGSGQDEVHALAVDSQGNAFVAGVTASKDFPVVGGIQGDLHGATDGFVMKVNAGGDRIIFSTYLGGSDLDRCEAIAVDSIGRAYVAGSTRSPDFPVLKPARPYSGETDAFIARFKSDGTQLEYATFLGGSGNDEALGIAVDAANKAYVTGWTTSADFPVVSAFSAALRGRQNAFVASLTEGGNDLTYSTYLGGTVEDRGLAVRVNSDGEAFVTGWTRSPDFPTRSSVQSSLSGPQDAFFVRLSATGATIIDGSYLGGSGVDDASAILIDDEDRAYLAGDTVSRVAGRNDFPSSGRRQADNSGSGAFFAQLDPCRYEFSWTTKSFDHLGGSDQLLVTPNAPNCEWGVTELPAWISGQATAAVGTGALMLKVGPNSGRSMRQGLITIEGHKLTVSQNALQTAGSLTVATDYAAYATGQAVDFSGQFLDSTGVAIANATIGIQITQGSTNRSVSGATNSAGNYTIVYQPPAGDVGVFQATASGTSNSATVTATTSFQIFGAPIQVPSGSLPLGNTTWGQTGAVYVVPSGGVTVPQGATLTIQPGVIVKFQYEPGGCCYTSAYLDVKGSLVANGTAAQPIYFTSIRDDAIGGDTNGDGNATSPAAGDWSGIRFDSGATGSISNAVIRYGGGSTYYGPNYAALDIASGAAQPTLGAGIQITDSVTGLAISGSGTNVSLSGAALARNGVGIQVNSGQAAIDSNTFTNNALGFQAATGAKGSITNSTMTTAAGGTAGSISAGYTGTLRGNTSTGAGLNIIKVQSGTHVTGAVTWGASIPYWVDSGGAQVDAGGALTIESGVIVKFRYEPGGCCYTSAYLKVLGSLTASGTVTQPVYFTSDRDDTVGGDSNGDGSATHPALGDWSGIRFDSGATGSLSYAVIRYGGGSTYYGPNYAALDVGTGSTQPVLGSGIQITDNITGLAVSGSGTNVSISGATFARNTTGIALNSGSAAITGNTFTSNGTGVQAAAGTGGSITGNTFTTTTGETAMSLSAGYLGTQSENTSTGSGINGINIPSGTAITGNANWGQVGIPYVINSGSLTVNAGATLTIQPGVIVKFQYEPGGCCYTSAYLDVKGSLVANGTAAQPIYFTSIRDDAIGGDTNGDGNATSPAAGDWSGIRFDSGATGSISNAVIRYGGGSTYYGPNYAALDIASGAAQPTLGAGIQITDSVTGLAISGSGTNVSLSGATFARNTTGIALNTGSATITGNTFTNNALGFQVAGATQGSITNSTITTAAGGTAGQISAAYIGTLSGNTSSGAGLNIIKVQSGTHVTGLLTWGGSIPYWVDQGGAHIDSGGTLTIQPGVIVKFRYAPGGCCYSSAYLEVQGTLAANGTAAQPVYFTSDRDDTIGGDSNGDGGATTPAAGDWSGVRFDSGATGSLSYAVIRYGGGSTYYGANYAALDIGTGSTQPTLGAGIQFANNLTGLAVSGSATNVALSGATLIGNVTGILVNSGLPVISGSTLTANLTAISLNGGTATLSSNSILANGTGVQVTGSGTNPLILSNIFAGNSLAIHVLSNAAPLIHDNDIAGNTFGVQNDSSVIVDATANFWGASNGPSQAGTGSGDKVSTNVNFTPFLTVANGATTNQFQILLVTPSHGGNSGNATLQVYGTGFQNGASLKIAGGGHPDLIGTNTQISDLGFVLTSTLNLTGAAAGLRDVVVTNPSGASTTLSGAFTVDQGGSPNIAVSLIGRNVMRAGQSQPYFINVANSGNVDSGSVRVWLVFPNYIQWQAPGQTVASAGQQNGLTYVAFNVFAVPAGSNTEIPVVFMAPDNPIYAHRNIQVQVWKEGQ